MNHSPTKRTRCRRMSQGTPSWFTPERSHGTAEVSRRRRAVSPQTVPATWTAVAPEKTPEATSQSAPANHTTSTGNIALRIYAKTVSGADHNSAALLLRLERNASGTGAVTGPQ